MVSRPRYHRKGGVRHFLAVYDFETDRLYGQFTRRKTSVRFLAFLKWVRRYPPQQVLHIVLDDCGRHLKAGGSHMGRDSQRSFLPHADPGVLAQSRRCHFTALRFALQTSGLAAAERDQRNGQDCQLAQRTGHALDGVLENP